MELQTQIRDFFRNENGATAIEYGLIAALIGVGIIASLSSLYGAISDNWGVASDAMADVE